MKRIEGEEPKPKPARKMNALTVQEEIDGDMSRMMDEGGGVVDQSSPLDAPIHRNDLVDLDATL